MKKFFALLLSLVLLLSVVSVFPSFAVSSIDRSGWQVSATSSNSTIEKILDGDGDTYWHSYFTASGSSITYHDTTPFRIYITLPAATDISGFCYLPRTDNNNGIVKTYKVYVSEDGVKDAYLVDSGSKTGNDYDVFTRSFGFNIKAKVVVFEITSAVQGYGTCAEFDLLGKDSSVQQKTVTSGDSISPENTITGESNAEDAAAAAIEASHGETAKGEYIGNSGWVAVVSAGFPDSGQGAQAIIDGDPATYWHSYYEAEGPTITYKETVPFRIMITLPTATDISGFTYTPRTDNNNGIMKSYKFYASEDGKTAYLIDSGDKTNAEMEPFTKNLGFNVKAKAVILEMTNTVLGFGTCAELQLIGAVAGNPSKALSGESIPCAVTGAHAVSSDGKPVAGSSVTSTAAADTDFLPRAAWQVKTNSEEPGTTANIIDGDPATYWHSEYTAEGPTITWHETNPFYITITLPSATTISGFRYTPRTDNNNGVVNDYKVYVSEDGKSNAFMVDRGTRTSSDKMAFTKKFDATYKAKVVVFELVSSIMSYGTCAEFDLLKGTDTPTAVPTDTESVTMKGEKVDAPGALQKSDFLPTTGWKIEANSQGAFEAMIDDAKSTYWHSFYTADGGKILSHDNPPFRITVTLSEPTFVSGLSYTPRQDQDTGRFRDYVIYTKDTETGKEYKIAEGEWENTVDDKVVDFTSNVKAKVVILETNTTQSGYGTCAELRLVKQREGYKDCESGANFKKGYIADKSYPIEMAGWLAMANSVWGEGSMGAQAIDGKTNTCWHTLPADRAKYPFTLDIEMVGTHTLTGFDYSPRRGDSQGYVLEYSIYASTDGENFELIDGIDRSFPESYLDDPYTLRHVDFKAPVDASALRIEVNNSYNGHCAIGELTFYETGASAERNDVDTSETYELKIGSPDIAATRLGESKDITIDVAPFIDNGRTMIPLRGLLEAMGAEISWDGETQTIVVKQGKTEITLQIVNNLVYVYKYYGGMYKTIRYTLDVPPKIKSDRTFIPIRFVSEHLGYDVFWEAETQTITISRE